MQTSGGNRLSCAYGLKFDDAAFSHSFLLSQGFRVDGLGNVTARSFTIAAELGAGTAPSPRQGFDVSGDSIRTLDPSMPAHSDPPGAQGQICGDNNYIYICVADNTWKRVALSADSW